MYLFRFDIVALPVALNLPVRFVSVYLVKVTEGGKFGLLPFPLLARLVLIAMWVKISSYAASIFPDTVAPAMVDIAQCSAFLFLVSYLLPHARMSKAAGRNTSGPGTRTSVPPPLPLQEDAPRISGDWTLTFVIIAKCGIHDLHKTTRPWQHFLFTTGSQK